MHSSDSQTRLMKSFMDHVIEDPLKYETITFDPAEFDNVPPIIPNFCIKMAKQVEALIGHCHARN